MPSPQVDTAAKADRLQPVASLLISQPKPSAASPYDALAEKYGLRLDYRPFIKVEQVPFKEFLQQKIHLPDYGSVILTSRNAVDNYFRVCKDARFEPSAETKYFCVSDQTANYLQKYIQVRKRKLYVGERTASDLFPYFKKFKGEKFLYPCSNIRKEDIPAFLRAQNFEHAEAVLYRTVASDLSDLSGIDYDMIAFFSPSGVKSLLVNFPNFVQNGVRIAAFGPTTARAVREAGLVLDIEAPHPDAPSMSGAIELYLKKANQTKKRP